jgi:hypothetical protein
MSKDTSVFEEAILESNDLKRTVDIRSGIIAFEYYEDIFSPTITAKIKIVNAGNSIRPPNSQGESDGSTQSLYNGLPLRGGERLSIKIAPNTDSNIALDFSRTPDDYLYVSSITDVISESQTESFTLHLVSREAITNETIRVSRKYSTNSTIDNSVKSILKDVLKTDKFSDKTVDKSSNSYGFIGNQRKPFTVLIWLASKAVPVKSGDATAGFLFYQTQEGFNFKSIDELISKEEIATYTYTESTVSYENENKVNNDFKILDYTTDKNQNLIEKLKLGTYSSYRMFFNPLTFEFTDPAKGLFKLSDYVSKTNNLGEQLKLPKIGSNSSQSLGDVPTRIITQVLDIGTLEPGVSTDLNSDPFKYQSQTLMRYNILFTQSLSMIVSLNTNLKAGDIIRCNFPKISSSNDEEYDKEQSGLYMIKEICHHFDIESSYTSMKLIRDTFGENQEARTKR